MPTITVDPPSSRIDKLTTIKVTGLQSRQRFRLSLESNDAHGVTWRSSDTLEADDQGAINVTWLQRRTRNDPMYLFNQLAPLVPIPAGQAWFYSWATDEHSWSDSQQRPFTLTGHDVNDLEFVDPWATIQLDRGAGVSAMLVDVQPGGTDPHLAGKSLEYGLSGRFFEPAANATRDAAILVFGGSEGRLNGAIQVAAGLFAADGYPTLALQYFTPPPTPVPWDGFWTELSQIPLEYFKGALDWLHAKTNAQTMFVSGSSRGSEAALLLAANYGHILGNPPAGPYAKLGVIANVPSASVNTGITPDTRSTGHSAWTLGGNEIPFDDLSQRPHDSAAEIPVEQIAGPIFLDGGEDDNVWKSDIYIEDILARLRRNGGNPHVDWHLYRRGGHGLCILVAYLPRAFSPEAPPPPAHPPAPPSTIGRFEDLLRGVRKRVASAAGSLANVLKGSSARENSIIDADLWPKLLAFLHTHS